MNKLKIQEEIKQLKLYVDAIDMENSRPSPNYLYIQSKVNIIPLLTEQLQKELKQ